MSLGLNITFLEKIFAKVFKLVAGKDYLICFHWNLQSSTQFIPLSKTVKQISLAIIAFLSIGLISLFAELTYYSYYHSFFRYHQKQNFSLKEKLKSNIKQQEFIHARMDSLSEVEEHIRALYGMNALNTNLNQFSENEKIIPSDSLKFNDPVFEKVQKAALLNTQLQGKINFEQESFRQIQDFVKYKHHLWEHTPSIIPAKGQWTSPFGYRVHPVTGQFVLHEGLDISNSMWTPIYATASGTVQSAGESGFFGNLIVIDHGNGYMTKFGHCSKTLVNKGQLVNRYTLIGYMGNSGRATGVHVHYEVHHDGNLQNPEKFILPSGILVD